MLKFFMKQELLWTLPIAGLTCWVLGFPFMKRYSKSYLKKHPEKKGKDIESTRRACARYKHRPTSIMNFVEGTRFTPEKNAQQNSPYQHLLNPKAGSVAFVLAMMGEQLHDIINVTIVYPKGTNIWKFLCGQVNRITIRYELQPITDEVYGDYANDTEFRRRFHRWLKQLWQDKDALVSKLS